MNCNDAAGGKFNDLRSAIGPRGKWVVGFGHVKSPNLCCLAGYGISGKAQLLAGWLGFGARRCEGRDGSYRERHDGLKCPCKPRSDYPTSIAAPNALLSPS
jgi:hypothetical protein